MYGDIMMKLCEKYLCVVTTMILMMEAAHFVCSEVKFIKDAKLNALYKIEEATQKMKRKISSALK